MDSLFAHGDAYLAELEQYRSANKRKAQLKSAADAERDRRDAELRKPLRDTDPWL